ncbi:hypothetical protein ACERK3_18575 [Phycisphaerales bacterium AB-hyl4]|uniref:Transposase n=1 Tax=Natronomicrosphaera hydrolytica TaxID=3242702 RepID=A0ABV4U9K3_9BACT
MSQSIPRIPDDQQSIAPSRRRYTDAFKQQAARLVTHERCTVAAAAEAVRAIVNACAPPTASNA